MVTLTIVKDDKFVSIDGVGLNLDAVVLPANVHAIQWDGSAGWIESISAYSTITNDHATKKAADEAATTTENNEQTALEASYGWKRQFDLTINYPSIGEQLDQQYHDAVNGTTTWKDAIAAVKAAHPKPE